VARLRTPKIYDYPNRFLVSLFFVLSDALNENQILPVQNSAKTPIRLAPGG
jgi:hypothetical protein